MSKFNENHNFCPRFAIFLLMNRIDSTLYFITDSTSVPEDRFLPVVEAACKGGATIIQLRAKDKSTRVGDASDYRTVRNSADYR